jgi:hypothetical protein
MERLEFSWGLRCRSVVANTEGCHLFLLRRAPFVRCTLYLMCFVYTQNVGFAWGFALHTEVQSGAFISKKESSNVMYMYLYI